VEAFSPSDLHQALDLRIQGLGQKNKPLSIYVHIPFCESLCYYCACNKIITKHHDNAEPYLRYLAKEVSIYTSAIGIGKSVSQLHLGGGTPTFLSDTELSELMSLLKRSFSFAAGGEYSVEVDPRTVNADRLKLLFDLGFNRLSFGVQDFDPDVQKAVHRIQPAEQVFDLVASARSIGFESVNVDLIYGLPKQTPDSFDATMRQIKVLRPDRIALYAYAHLPERFKPQRRILAAELPLAADKIAMLSRSMEALMNAGYVYVGMDHFALPEDALAVAKRQGRLHRNFQGYSTQSDCDLIGLGVSAIGRMGSTYSQNAKTMDEYVDMLDQGQLPIVKGLALSRDDQIRRAWIMAIMCQGHVQYDAFNEAWLIDAPSYFAAELMQLESMQTQGLVELSKQGLHVTPMGWFFVRGVAMVFDKYLQADRQRNRFSKII
jgi:oxygen-independent coproporphyrinogen-3 oxidase